MGCTVLSPQFGVRYSGKLHDLLQAARDPLNADEEGS